MRTKVDFVNKVIRQGNSLCVRIPSTIVKEGKLKQGMEVLLTIVLPPKDLYKYDEKSVQELLSIAGRIKKLDRYSELKKRFFIMLNFKFLEETAAGNGEEKQRQQLNFIKKKKEEFGMKLINEFIDFGMTLNKEAFLTDEDGTAILKPKYRTS